MTDSLALSREAKRERVRKQNWAAPGSRHDRLVKLAKIALPSAVGVLIAFLALAPLDRSGDVSFILDKNKVDNAPERMRVDSARYTGEDSLGRPFEIVARSAVQPSSDEPTVNINGMLARLALPQGPVTMLANLANYDLDLQKVAVRGPVRVAGPDGYRLNTRDVTIDMKARRITGSGRVEGEMKLGRFSAGRLSADLGERTITLDQGARLKIVQGAVKS
ncbi:LPS export ABC transporter periplasmic protein LptC [Sphingomonas sabuli]|uniref:LPS export ABC transporter periplasmic protein LptC n=1 Tax=Sphingomonas sabuli TaxID=2764186 RepID=A0A7G9L0L8_9SPHN|nr:LPS export ABC transporter periplasmic protein LptC [Sphingomonas sabuli]QNM82167.1 LPS export ABC transporter periplasmic protein LptC [Sphingomonas sabuli]